MSSHLFLQMLKMGIALIGTVPISLAQAKVCLRWFKFFVAFSDSSVLLTFISIYLSVSCDLLVCHLHSRPVFIFFLSLIYRLGLTYFIHTDGFTYWLLLQRRLNQFGDIYFDLFGISLKLPYIWLQHSFFNKSKFLTKVSQIYWHLLNTLLLAGRQI